MADELGIKISAELDTTKADSQLQKFKSKVAKEKASVKIDDIQIDQKSINSSFKKAISEFSKQNATSPIKLAFDVDAKAVLSKLTQSLQNSPIRIPVELAPTNLNNFNNGGNGGRNNNRNGGGNNNNDDNRRLPGVPYTEVTGSKRFADVFDNEVAKYRKQFEDLYKNYTLASSSVKYDPVNKQYSALIKYQNALGNTTSMLLRMDEATQQLNVTQTGFSENFAQQAKDIEATKAKLTSFRTEYDKLYASAFSKKDPLSGTFGDEATKALDNYKNAISSVKGTLTKTDEANINALKELAKLTIDVQRSKQYSATDLRAKEVASKASDYSMSLDTRITELRQAGIYTEELQWKFQNLKNALASVADSAGLSKYLNDLSKVENRVKQIEVSARGQGLMQAKQIDTSQLAKLSSFQHIVASGDLGLASTDGIENLRAKLASLTTEYQNVQATLRSENITDNQFHEASVSVEMLDKQLASVTTTMKNLGNADYMTKMGANIDKLKSDYAYIVEQNASAFKNSDVIRAASQFESKLKNIDALSFSSVKEEFSSLVDQINKVNADTNLKKDIALKNNSLSARIEELKQAGLYTDSFRATYTKLQEQLGQVTTAEGLRDFNMQLQKAEQSVREFQTSFEGQGLLKAQSIDNNQLVKLAEFQSTLSSGTLGAANTTGIDSLRSKVSDLISQYQQMQDLLDRPFLTEEEFRSASVSVGMLDKELASVTTTMKNLGNADYMDKMNSRIEKLRANYETLKNANAAAFANPEVANSAAQFEQSLRNVDAVNFSNVQAQFTALSAKIREVGTVTRDASVATTGFGTELKNTLKFLLGIGNLTMVIRKIVSGIKEIASNVTDINSAMTELKKVTDLSDAAYNKFLSNAGSTAKTIGTTITDLIDSTASFSRLGFNFDDAQTLAEVTNVYYRVGDEISDIDEASQSITSTMQAFGYSADEAIQIVDKLNIAGNNMAISSGGLGTALQDSASALAASNNSLDESIALIAAANRVAQDPSSVGTAWRTVALRIRGNHLSAPYCGNTVATFL